nr:RNA-dependent RNA polymerase [Picobirnavirus sp.]
MPDQVRAILDYSGDDLIKRQAQTGLSSALKRLETGSQPTPRSWFYETKKDPEDVLEPVIRKLSSMQDLKVISEWDLSKESKYGPQGGAAPLSERLESFNEYFEHLSRPLILQDPSWQRAKKRAIRELKLNGSGVPLSVKAVLERGIGDNKYNTNSGYPLFLKRKNPVALKEAMSDARIAIQDQFPCTLGSRATMGKTGKDARNIFMAAMAVNVSGQCYQMKLQDYLRSLHLSFFLPWEGWDHVQKEISAQWDGTLKFGADYTKMDQHFNVYHGLEVYDVIKYYFKKAYWENLKQTIIYVFHVPILTNLGYVDQEHAMPSGSEWTNFLETVWNYIFTLYLEEKYHLSFQSKMGIGDDQLWFIRGEWTQSRIDKLISLVISEFEAAGLPGNPEKQEVSMTKTGFLQRLCSSEWDGVDGKTRAAGVYSLVRNVTSQVFPERYHNERDWNADMFALRCIMIAENANQHPLFKWYILEYLAKANSNILEFVRKRDKEILNTQKHAKNIAGFLPTYNQEKADQSILDFEAFKLLRTLVQ